MSIASEIERLKNAKTSIASAIEEKGVAVPAETSIDEYGNYVSLIPSGDYATKEELEALSNTANAADRVKYESGVLKTLGGTEIVTGNARIATGSYVGAGASGASNPCVLTFDFEPKFLQIYAVGHSNRAYDSYALTIKMPALTTAYQPYMYITNQTETSQFYAKKSADGKVVYFYYQYAKDYFHHQFNEANVNYYYVAIG